MNLPRIVRFDWEAVQRFVDAKRAEHDARTPAEAARISLEAFNRWGERPPLQFTREVLAAHLAGK